MRPYSSLKHEFLKKWIMGLQRCKFSKKKTSILERKKAIKLSADIAMASARNGTTRWSRALISKHGSDNHLVRVPESDRLASNKCPTRRASVRRKIARRSCRMIRRTRSKCAASSVAKCLVRKRTRVLKSLIPGGEFMNEICLIDETLDYIMSLRVQVDVMRNLASASELAVKA